MNQEQWTAIDRYFSELLIAPDLVLDAALDASAEAGLPAINVSPAQGKLLMLLAQMCGARRILEIGTLAGYSTIWLARGLPADGRLLTVELDPAHADIACSNLTRAGLNHLVTVRVGSAAEVMPQLIHEQVEPFDLIFLDADKTHMTEYFRWSLELSRVGTVIIADNVVRKGAVVDANSGDATVEGVRRFNEALAAERRVSATAIQTVGTKGYDGFALVRVVADA